MKRLPNIQILRACAALMVFIYHAGMEMSRIAASTGQRLFYDQDPWRNGVPLFFAISGFIMVATSAESFGQKGAASDFMRRRLIRIVPLYWCVTTGALAMALIAPHLMKMAPGDWLYVASSYLFWPAVRATGDVRPLATPGWTLNLEMLFYVVFAAGLMMERRKGLALVFALLGGLVAARVAGVLPGPVLNFWGDPIVIGFLLGGGIGVAYLSDVRLGRLPAIALGAGGFILLLHAPIAGMPEDALLARLADAVPAAIILAAFALGGQVDEKRAVWKPLLMIGDASYSLYLIHEFLLRPLQIAWIKAGLHLPLPLFMVAGAIISLSAAWASYKLVEEPSGRWLKRITEPARAGGPHKAGQSAAASPA